MKKRNYLLAMTIICMALVSSQSMMAKKLVYLGHNYDGKVKNKIPEGEGKIFVGNLKILGTFSANTVTNASVSWYDQTIPNAMYVGTVVFDESNNITLKAGGMYKIYYFPPRNFSYNIEDRKSFDETIAEDRITSSLSVDSLFNPKMLKIPYRHVAEFKDKYNGYYEGFNLPRYVTTRIYTNVTLEDIECSIDQWGRYKVKTKAFVYKEPYWDEQKPVIMKDSKDKEGRTWNINYVEYNHDSNWTVSYPGGSWYKKNNIGLDDSFELHFPDGKIYKTKTVGSHNYLNLDQNFSTWITPGDIRKVFLENVKQDHLVLSYDKNSSIKYIYSESIDFSNYSEQDVENFLKEKVFPYYKELSDESFTLLKSADSFESKNWFASYKNGKITIYAKQRAQNMEKVRKEYNDYVNQLKKKYGAKYVDDAMNGKLYVGMPLDILCDTELWDAFEANYGYQPFMSDYTWSVYKRNTTLGIYRIQRWNKRKGIHDYFIVRVRNGKITRIDND